jgi:myosin heavy subunit
MQDQKVWILDHPTLLFGEGNLTGVCPSNPSLFLIRDNEGNSFSLKENEFKRIRSNINCHSGDLLDLEDLNQQTLLFNIRKRFASQKIYSSIGTPILVAVNPYQNLPIYNTFTKARFTNLDQDNLLKSDPHIFKTSEISYRNLVSSGKSQNIIITGESGAGKTESTKFILDYIASREKKKLTSTLSGEDLLKQSSQMDTLEKRILLANPVLEAFGNAKTLRNDNSSRFGKYIEIFFSDQQQEGLKKSFLGKKMKIEGARINNYLLENSRIDGQSGNERNYHVFYNLLAKAQREQSFSEQFHISFEEDYQCVNTSNQSFPTEFWKKKLEEFDELFLNFKSLQFNGEEVNNIIKIISGIMNMSNIYIHAVSHNKSEIKENDKYFEKCLSLFGIKRETLNSLICFKSIKDPMTKKLINIPVGAEKAQINKKTLSKMIYNQLFDWLIFKVNLSISGKEMLSVKVLEYQICV